MTQKHFEAIAKVLNEYHAEARLNKSEPMLTLLIERIARDMANEFATFNSLFDRARFINAVIQTHEEN